MGGVNLEEYTKSVKAAREHYRATSKDYEHMTLEDAATIQSNCDDISNLAFDLVSLFIEDPTLFNERERETLSRHIRERLAIINQYFEEVSMRQFK